MTLDPNGSRSKIKIDMMNIYNLIVGIITFQYLLELEENPV